MSGLRTRDWFQIATTGLFLVLGLAIIVRAGVLRAPLLAYVVGLVFVGLGVHRARFIVRALGGKG
jgi:hypothetical protein